MRQIYLLRIQGASFFKDTKRNWSGIRKRSLKINDQAGKQNMKQQEGCCNLNKAGQTDGHSD